MNAITNPFETSYMPKLSPKTTRWVNSREYIQEIIRTIQETLAPAEKVALMGVSIDDMEGYIQSVRQNLEAIMLAFLKADLVDKYSGEPIDWNVLIEMHTPFKTKRQLIANIKNHNVSIQTLLHFREEIIDEFMLKEEL